MWEWGKTFSLSPQHPGNISPGYGKTNYSHKKMQICPVLKKLDNGAVMNEVGQNKATKEWVIYATSRGSHPIIFMQPVMNVRVFLPWAGSVPSVPVMKICSFFKSWRDPWKEHPPGRKEWYRTKFPL